MAGYGRMDVSQGGGPQQQVQAHQQLPLVEPPAVAAVAAAAAQAAQAQQNQVQQGPQPPALASVPALAGPSQAGQQQQPLIPVGAGVVPAPSPQPVVVGPIPQAQGPSAINGTAGVIQPPQVSLDYIIRGAGTFRPLFTRLTEILLASFFCRFLINLNNHKCLPSYHRRGFKYLRLFNNLS